MAGGSVSEPPDNKCRFCGKFASTSDIKCKNVNCDVIVHTKCFDTINKLVKVDKNNFRCRTCYELFKSNQKATDAASTNNQILLLEKEIECLNREKEVINKYVSELEYINNVLKGRVLENTNTTDTKTTTFLSQNISTTKTYAAAMKSTVNCLLVKSIDDNVSNKQVENVIKTKINPCTINASIIGTKLIKNGVLINCEDKESLDNLKKCISRETGTNYNITFPKKLNPRIIIYNVDPTDIEDSNFIENVIAANQLICQSDHLRHVTTMKFKDKVNVILETVPPLFNTIINKGFLYIGWSKCHVKEHFSLIRCYKCCKFGHYKKDCRSETVICSQCSGSHEKNSCPSKDQCCANCKSINARYKSNLNTAHSANSPQCHYYLQQLATLKSKTQYGD